jgi:glutathione synthase/RimK-type ligase-like ATP-grasp enzyme
MGKGITYLSRSSWRTNFIFKNNKIISKRSDFGWRFQNITGSKRFLKQLLKKDVIVQEGIDPLKIDGHIMDLRIYTFLGKVIYIYPRVNAMDEVTTNISQGGKGDPKALKYIPKYLINRAVRTAEKTAKALTPALMGIDIVVDKNLKEVFVIDANLFPGFPRRKIFNLARRIARILNKARRKKTLSLFSDRVNRTPFPKR